MSGLCAAGCPGSAPNLPLHEAWTLLLKGFLPFLANEASFLADLLLMFKWVFIILGSCKHCKEQ
jgi:hypothetical protein